MDLNKLLSQININANWIGLREVKESTTFRIIRDLNPEIQSVKHRMDLILCGAVIVFLMLLQYFTILTMS